MKKILVGSVAVAAASMVAIVSAAAAPAHNHRHAAATTVTTTSVAPAPASTTTTAPLPATTTTTSTTLPPKPVDPLAGVAMLRIHDRQIIGLDANGNDARTLVTAYEGRTVTQAQMMSDHHTIWYVTQADWRLPHPADAYNCADVVRLDLESNHRTVIAHASSFSVSADGSRVLLVGVERDADCHSATYNLTGDVVRDLRTGAESKVDMDAMVDYVLSPHGHLLVASECTSDSTGCHFALRVADVPDRLGAPIRFRPINDPSLSFMEMDARSDGLYAVVDTQPQDCGCGGHEDRYDRDITVRRFSWSNLGGAGETLQTLQGPFFLDSLLVGDGHLYGVGQTNGAAPEVVYSLGTSGPHALRTLPSGGDGYDWYAAMPPFAG